MRNSRHSDNPHITVLILNYYGITDTLECLASLQKCTYPNFDVIVLDNGSPLDQVKILQQYAWNQYRFIDNQINLGFAEGNNVGIRVVLKEQKSDYIYLLNNDTAVDPLFLDEVLKTARKYPLAGIVGSLSIQFYKRHLIENAGHDFLDCGDSVPRKRNEPFTKKEVEEEVLGICAAGALYRTDMLQTIGLFDKDFFLNYEDVDISLRAILYGYTCIISPQSIIYHKVNTSIQKMRDDAFNVRSQYNQLKAYYFNTPSLVLVCNFPVVFLRNLFVIGLNILFLRWNIVRVFLNAYWLVLKNNRSINMVRKNRMTHKKVSSWYILKQQRNFLPVYIRYFIDIIIHRQRSTFDITAPILKK